MKRRDFLLRMCSVVFLAALLMPGWQVVNAEVEAIKPFKLPGTYMKFNKVDKNSCSNVSFDNLYGIGKTYHDINNSGEYGIGIEVKDGDRKYMGEMVFYTDTLLPPYAKLELAWNYQVRHSCDKTENQFVLYHLDTKDEASTKAKSMRLHPFDPSATSTTDMNPYLVCEIYRTKDNSNNTYKTGTVNFTFDNSTISSKQNIQHWMILGVTIQNGSGHVHGTVRTTDYTYSTLYYPRFNGTGSQSSPLQIGSAADLRAFADVVNSGVASTKNIYAVLTADIDYTKYTDLAAMIGNDNSHRFSGVFDGNGHSIQLALDQSNTNNVALFRFTQDATIKNLSVRGSVKGSIQVASIVGEAHGNIAMENVSSSATLTAMSSSVDGLGNGGLIMTCKEGNIYLTNCAFTGKMLKQTQGSHCGGLVGWVYDNLEATIKNCFFAPDSVNVGADNSFTLVRLQSSAAKLNLDNCYYTYQLGAAQGTKVSEAQMKSGEICWKLNGSTNEGSPWLQTIGVDRTPCLWGSQRVYERNGLFYNFEPPFRGAGTETDPFQLETYEHLSTFRDYVNKGYTSLCAKLVADIDMANHAWMPMGYHEGNTWVQYHGTFDGNGYTLSNLNVNKVFTCGLFGEVGENATIKNLIIHNATIIASGGGTAPFGWAKGKNIHIFNCGVTGIIKLTSSNNQCAGLAVCDGDGITVENSYTVYEGNVILQQNGAAGATNCYCNKDNDVEKKRASGELTYLLNGGKGDLTPWVQTLGRDAYPRLRGAKSVKQNGTKYENIEYTGGDEAGFIETTSGKDFRVIHHGGRLYEFIVTVATQDDRAAYTLPNATIKYLDNDTWTELGKLSDINKDTLPFAQDWWGKIDISKGTWYTPYTYNENVPSFWAYQGNHSTCKQASLLWVAPSNLTDMPRKFMLSGTDASSQLSFNATIESTIAAGDDSGLSFVDPVVNVQSTEAGSQFMFIMATNKAYAYGIWDATDNRFISTEELANATTSLQLSLPQVEKNHNLVALVCSRHIETSAGRSADTTYVNYAYPFVLQPIHSIVRSNSNATHNINNSLQWAIVSPDDTDVLDTDPFIISRAYSSDYSDLTTLTTYDLSDYQRTSVSYDTLFGWYDYTDNTAVDYSQVIKTDDSVSVFDSWNISASAHKALNEYRHPACYVYYKVYRPIITTLWNDSIKYSATWKVLQDKALPTIDSVYVIQDTPSSNKIKVRIVLNNPYPWEVVGSSERDAVRNEAEKQNFNHRMFNWDTNASILLQRFSMNTSQDMIAKMIEISGSKVQWDSQSGVYYVEYEDMVSIPFVDYQYKAKVIAPSTTYPICESRNIYRYSNSVTVDKYGGIANLKASRGTLNGAVQITWDADENEYTTLTLKRREYKRGYVSSKELAGWTTIEASNGVAYDQDAKAAVVNEYILTITTRVNDSTSYTASDTTYGYADYYGSIDGRVIMSNGVNMPGNVSVSIQCDSVFVLSAVKHPKTGEIILPACHYDAQKYTVNADANGAYTKDSIPYYGAGMQYTVAAICDGAPTFVSPSGSAGNIDLVYDDDSHAYSNIDFTCNDTKHFSGRILYTNSTVPVRDVMFKVNGSILRNAKGEPVVSDAMGNFSFIVPRMEVTIQAYRDGHTMSNGGYILGGTDGKQKIFTPTKDYDGLVIDDDTRVRLVGRVAGGDVEGNKPMGFGLSKNILGDSITLVFTLEGDHTSYLYYDKKNPNNTSYTQQFTQSVLTNGVESQDIPTDVSFEAKRIVVKADNKTGEFCLDLFPTKYVLSQVYANGYSTLYSAGEGLTVVDLTDSVGANKHYYEKKSTNYDGSFCKVYHAPVQVDLLQLRDNKYQKLYGAKQMEVNMLSGTHTMQLSWLDKDGNAAYTFSNPLFNGHMQASFQVKAFESYYYNNDISGAYVRVPMTGYTVSVSNGLSENGKVSGDLVLNTEGFCIFNLVPNNTSFTLTEKNALRYLSAAVDINGYRYESEPIAAYVTGERDFGVEVTSAMESTPRILDIVRDPYGTGSYAYRAEGTTYRWARIYSNNAVKSLNLSLDLGVALLDGIGFGVGMVTSSTSTVDIHASGSLNAVTSHDLTYKNGQFSLTLNDRVVTSSSPLDQGAIADVYIGSISTADLYKYQALSVVDGATYAAIQPMIETGAAKLVKSGVDAQGNPSYFVICNGVTWAPGTERTFIYSQRHILNVLIPQLKTRRSEAFRVAANLDEALKMSEASGKAFYYMNSNGEYTMVAPSAIYQDTVALLDEQIKNWQNVIAANERKKVDAMSQTPSVQYSVAGTAIDHSETASTYYRETTVEGDKPMSYNWGISNRDADATKHAEGTNKNKDQKDDTTDSKDDTKNPTDDTKKPTDDTKKLSGFTVNFNMNLKRGVNSTQLNIMQDFTIASGGSGYMITALNNCYFDMDVYYENDSSILMVNNTFKTDVNNYEGGNGLNDFKVTSETQKMTDNNTFVHSYIFVVRGGATREPWLDADSTCCYMPDGVRMPLGTRTLKMNKPVLSVENPVVNNLPQDEKAVFTIHISNESELSANTENVVSTLYLHTVDATNPYGAKLSIDGEPLHDKMAFMLAPGQSVTKTLEVERGGKPYDYENIGLLLSDNTYSQTSTAAISVHYLPTSTPLTLSLPAQNFLINTLSQQDEDGKYYIPVQIEGFSTAKYDNFDHIELQYKRQTDSEDQWVNLCSYFISDSLYKQATGTKAMIETEGKITNIRFYGEKDPVEQQYELRAVSFCRLGNGYTTRMSGVISGTKDTRCPEVFGMPKPENGILSFDDVISLPFTEPIAYNYLDETANFSVQGYTNNSDADNSVALYFPGNANTQAVTSVDRVLNQMDFSIEAMVKIDADAKDTAYIMLIHDEFSEDPNRRMGFGYIPDKDVLIFGTGGNRVYSKPLQSTYGINLASAMTHVGVVYTVADSAVHFYVSEQEVALASSSSTVRLVCTANGPVYVGNGLKGKINNICLWSKALNLYEMTSKYKKRLTANESNLLAYWPADEGKGSTVKDKVHGANLDLSNVSWSLPNGYSVSLDHKTMAILKDQALKYTRNSREDYTISFYFKVDKLDGDANLFAAGSDDLAEQGMDKVRIRFVNGELYFMSEGQRYAFGNENNFAKDATWHHLAVSVNHGQNQAALFIDGQMVHQLDADKIGGVTGSNIVYGDTTMAAHIDQVQMWSLALPASYIKEYYHTALTGKEKELQIYLPFEREEMNSQATMYTAFSPLNHVIVASTGEIAGDTVIDETRVKADDKEISPVRSATGIENLPFTWKSTDNELQIMVNKSKAEINNQHINFVVRRVEDLNGNPMQNAQMWTTYVNRNILVWNENSQIIKLPYTHDTTLVVAFGNISGREVNYTLDCTNPYITLTPTMGTISPLSEKAVVIEVSDGLAPGVYSATVNLVDEDGLCSKHMLHIYVEAVDPMWKVVVDSTFKSSMDLAGMVMLKQQDMWRLDMNSRDKVGAFINDVCVGVANIQADWTGNTSVVFLNIKGNAKVEGKKVELRLYRALDGLIYGLTPGYTQADGSFKKDSIIYHSNMLIGDNQLIELRANEMRIQTIQIEPGWNWVSINVRTQEKIGINEVFSSEQKFSTGSVLKTADAGGFWTYDVDKEWNGYVDTILTRDKTYQIWSPVAVPMTVYGEAYNESNRMITLHFNKSGWADMPYLQESAMPINLAMSDFVAGSEKAPAGTMIKGYNSFAVARADGSWWGSLQTMRPGEGYYCRRNGLTDSIQIHYYDMKVSAPERRLNDSPVNRFTSSTMMPIVATFADGDYCEGDAVLALCNGQVIAESETLDKLFLLALHANQGETIQFAKVRDGEVVAVTSQGLKYDANSVAGTADHPYLIDFSEEEGSEDIYDILGRKLNNLPWNSQQVLIQGKNKIIMR